MDEKHIEELLVKDLKLAEENNKILKKMRRSIQWGRFFKVLYWAMIIVSVFGTYYFIQPYITFLQELTGSLPTKDVSAPLQGIESLFQR